MIDTMADQTKKQVLNKIERKSLTTFSFLTAQEDSEHGPQDTCDIRR
jgi:hypothetical protein